MNPTNKEGACSLGQNNQTADVHRPFRMTVCFQCQHKFISRVFQTLKLFEVIQTELECGNAYPLAGD